jgi:adenylate cyclase, class 2
MAAHSQETEIKLAVPDAPSARALLRRAGFRVSRPRVFEANTVFDTTKLALRKSSRLLRVRTAGPKATFTYKGKAAEGVRHKSREELEVELPGAPGAQKISAILERLDYRPVFRYEKYRTEFAEHRRAGTVVLDETPIGVYLELEGTEHWIDRTARRLGFSEDDYITASYGSLYLDWCRAHRRKPGNMVFE